MSALGVANGVLYMPELVPLTQYPFFLATLHLSVKSSSSRHAGIRSLNYGKISENRRLIHVEKTPAISLQQDDGKRHHRSPARNVATGGEVIFWTLR
ncbi:hypothetical protein Bca101_059521 [Brassica carinata]